LTTANNTALYSQSISDIANFTSNIGFPLRPNTNLDPRRVLGPGHMNRVAVLHYGIDPTWAHQLRSTRALGREIKHAATISPFAATVR
jgi:hypothetical protein